MNRTFTYAYTFGMAALCALPTLAQDRIEFRSIDGTGNNRNHSDWGGVGVDLRRLAPADYEDGVSSPAGVDRASPREISNLVLAQDASIINSRKMTDMVWQWGQFVDHDIDLTESADPAEAFPIAVPAGDIFFDPDGSGDEVISLFRSAFNPFTAPREQVNDITAFMDGSNVYGSDEATAFSLRSFEGGKLRVTTSVHGDLLPQDEFGFFLAGDVRVNEQVYLTSMHTLWMREHNRIADSLADENRRWSDERIYQHARRRVIAEMGAITFNEFLPALLGDRAIRPYQGYQRDVNPGIDNEFSTACYRVGHSMLSSELLRLDNNGDVIAAGNLPLRDAFFHPELVTEEGIEPQLKGLTAQAAQEIDGKIVDDIRNFLFGAPGAGGFDLGSLNIQRGRDHGLASYNGLRVAVDLPAIETFDEISSDPLVQLALFEAYQGDVDNIDAWVGALAEDHVRGSSVGPLMQRVISKQFENLRDGDRFWYERTFEGRELEEIQRTRLSDVIRRNTALTNVPENVFMLSDRDDDRDRDRDRNRDRDDDRNDNDSGRGDRNNHGGR